MSNTEPPPDAERAAMEQAARLLEDSLEECVETLAISFGVPYYTMLSNVLALSYQMLRDYNAKAADDYVLTLRAYRVGLLNAPQMERILENLQSKFAETAPYIEGHVSTH